MNFFQKWLLRLRNQLDYPLRQTIRWKRKGLSIKNKPKDHLFENYTPERKCAAKNRAGELIRTYHLETFYHNSTPINFQENLYYLDLIETAFHNANIALKDDIKVVDIGPSHWFYIQALYAALNWYKTSEPRKVELHGYEADAYRLYSDLHSRYDYAWAHIRGLPVKYYPKPFEKQSESYNLVFLFFPFVFEKDHIEWGLPSNNFNPLELRKNAWDSLKPKGYIVIVNQGKSEHEQEIENLATLGIHPKITFRQDNLLYEYDYQRYVLVAQHE